MEPTDHYTIISADCHAGADAADYRPYLESHYHDDFDAWLAEYVNPFSDLAEADAVRNWDSARRLADLDADGIAGEVIYPNTIPPFFPSGSLVAPPPTDRRELELRWAGLRAHNRWLADFCAAAPERRAGVGQILLNDLQQAVDEIDRIAEAGLHGGVLLPGIPPDSALPPLYAEHWEPLWAACASSGVVVNHHAGSAGPRPTQEWSAGWAVWVYETHWWAHRVLWHLVFSGVLERHPDLTLVLTEQGSGWLPAALESLDVAAERFARPGSALNRFAGSAGHLPKLPRAYWERQCYVGASFMRPVEVAQRHAIGVDRIMWGSDYPHLEGTAPYSLEALRHAFNDVEPTELAAILGGNAAQVYGFDLEALAPLASRIGPTVGEVATPLDAVPAGASSAAFEPEPIRTW